MPMGRSAHAVLGVVAFLTVLLAGAISSVGMEGDLDCADFGSRAEAQAHLRATPSDPDRLDGNNDGTACGDHDYASGTPSPAGAVSELATPIAAPLELDLKLKPVDLDCAGFPSQEAAQAALNADPGDPHGLDRNANGLACEHHGY